MHTRRPQQHQQQQQHKAEHQPAGLPPCFRHFNVDTHYMCNINQCVGNQSFKLIHPPLSSPSSHRLEQYYYVYILYHMRSEGPLMGVVIVNVCISIYVILCTKRAIYAYKYPFICTNTQKWSYRTIT